MFKLIFDKDKINFFISNLKHKGGDLKNGPALQSHFMFVKVNFINQRNVSHIKVSKYYHVTLEPIYKFIN